MAKFIFVACIYFFGTSTFQESWKTFSKDEYSIKYPENWKLDASGNMGTVFILFSARASETDSFRENINLTTQDFSKYTMSLDHFAQLSESQIKSVIENAKILESKKLENNGKHYYKIVYTGDQGPYTLKYKQYYFIENKKAYVLTYTSLVSTYDKYNQVATMIMDSFKV